MKHAIGRHDILPYETYAAERSERRQRMTVLKKVRRIEVGPFATFFFENYDTMFQQIHEMLYIERGGEAQIADELTAYNPLIPRGDELVATLMFEIDDPVRRDRELRRLAYVENFVTMEVDSEVIKALPEDGEERTSADGKTSAVHFLHFPFTPAQIAKFRSPQSRVLLAIAHENYGHMAVVSLETRVALMADFD